MIKELSDNGETYFYPRSPCGERQYLGDIDWGKYNISIHALLAESDNLEEVKITIFDISIHALLAESDVIANFTLAQSSEFLSTLSLRRATEYCVNDVLGLCISIHALLAESDLHAADMRAEQKEFLSTLSLRRATIVHLTLFDSAIDISIHALLAESDTFA